MMFGFKDLVETRRAKQTVFEVGDKTIKTDKKAMQA